MPRLTIQNGQDKGRQLQIKGGRATLGRSVNNDLQIMDRRMSRNHSEVFEKDGAWYARDLGSKNGTLVNGAPITLPVRLHAGDRVTVGDTDVLFEDESTSSFRVPGAPGESQAESSDPGRRKETGNLKLVDEHQWGSTQGELRAGQSPAASVTVPGDDSAALRESQRRLEIIYQVTDAIRSVFDLDELLNAIMDTVLDVFKPDSAYLLMRDPETGEVRPSVVRTADGESEVRISRSIVNRCINEGVSLLVSDAAMDQRFAEAQSIILNRIRTAIVAPFIYKQEPLGVVYVDTRTRMVPYSREELELLTGITNQCAMAIINARLHGQIVEQHKLAREMEIARTIQMNLLPKVYPDLGQFDVSAMSLPAKDVGGDYYDFIALPDGREAIAIADVSGKGVPAALLTATTRSYVQSETQHPEKPLTAVMERINRMVHRDVTNDMYVTMVMGYLDQASGALEYVNAGHNHPVLLRAGGGVEHLTVGGLFLGIMEDTRYDCGAVVLRPGDVLLLTTDGVTDILSPAGEAFGSERLMQLLVSNAGRSAEEIRNVIYEACVKHRAEADQFDDFTLIVLKRHAAPATPAPAGMHSLGSDFDEFDMQ